MRPRAGLGLDGRVPPGVDMDHRVGRRQVQPHAAGLQADQHQRAFLGLEAPHDLAALRHRRRAGQHQEILLLLP